MEGGARTAGVDSPASDTDVAEGSAPPSTFDALDLVPVPIIVTDAGGSVVFVNRPAAEVLEATPAELLGQSLERVVKAPLAECLCRLEDAGRWDGETWTLRRVVHGGQVVLVASLRHLERFGGDAEASPLRPPSDRLRRPISEGQLQTMVSNAPIVLFAIDREGVFTLSEGKGLASMGLIPGEVVGRSAFDIYRDRPGHLENMRRCVAGETFTVTVHERAHVLDAYHAPLHDDLGSYAGTVGVLVDVTERVQAEDARRASEQRFRALFDGAADAFVLHDEGGRIVDANEAACAALGYTRDEFLGLCVTDIELALGAGELAALWHRSRLGEIIRIEGQFRRRDGTTFPVDIQVTHFDRADRPLFFVSARDLSDQRRAEAERKDLAERLQHLQRLESVGRLAGGVAHDFNNLPTAIGGNVELALAGLPPEAPTREYLLGIRQAADSAASLTRQLLAFSRKGVSAPRVLDLNQAVERFSGVIRRLVGQAVDVVTVLEPRLFAVRVDLGQLEQILLNLAVNARDAMPEGGTLELSTASVTLDATYCAAHSEVTPGPHVLLTVSDTGTGMTAEILAHLFEPFFTTKALGQGTGLGLATVWGAVRQNKGSIDVRSTVGRGTTVEVHFPAVPQRPDSSRPAAQVASAGGTETIVLVEDDFAVRGLATRMLGHLGYRVLAFSDGTEALNALADCPEPVHLLLTDVVLPHMNGRMLAEGARRLRPTIRVLFTSGYTDEVVLRHGVQRSGTDFLPKPYTVEQLAFRIRETLDRRETPP